MADLDLTLVDAASPAITAAADALSADLRDVAGVLAGELLAAAHARAAGDAVAIHSGRYLDSLAATAVADARGVAVRLASDDPVAAILEYGGTIPPHEILPDVAAALRFGGGAGEVYAAHVRDPGGAIAPRRVLGGALDATAPEILAALDEVAARFVERAAS